MQYHATSGAPARQKTDCAIVGIFEKRKLSPAASEFNQASDGALKKILAEGDLAGKRGQTLLLRDIPGMRCKRLLLIGLGEKSKFDVRAHRQAVTAALKTWHRLRAATRSVFCAGILRTRALSGASAAMSCLPLMRRLTDLRR